MSEPTAIVGVPAATDEQTISDTQTTAIACVVDPTRLEDAVAALAPERLLPTLWFAEELVRRANALKKALLIEAEVALANGEIQPELRLADHRYVFRQDSKNELSDIGGLLYYLNRVGASVTDLGNAAGYVRVGDIQRIIAALPEDVRADAYETLEEHKVRKPTGWALVDLDSVYRRKK